MKKVDVRSFHKHSVHDTIDDRVERTKEKWCGSRSVATVQVSYNSRDKNRYIFLNINPLPSQLNYVNSSLKVAVSFLPSNTTKIH
jgi:hypothetical protein